MKKRESISGKQSMPCNKPVKSTRPGKKKMVKACSGGKEKLVHYGDSSMEDYTQHKDKKRRANFHSRHNCKSKNNKLKAGYWACKDLW
jgi:hypothetical protein